MGWGRLRKVTTVAGAGRLGACPQRCGRDGWEGIAWLGAARQTRREKERTCHYVRLLGVVTLAGGSSDARPRAWEGTDTARPYFFFLLSLFGASSLW